MSAIRSDDDLSTRSLPHLDQPLVAQVFDVVCWIAALTITSLIRYQVVADRTLSGSSLVVAFLVVIAAHLVIGRFLVYRQRWRIGSFEEAVAVSLTILASGAVLLVVVLVSFRSSISVGAVFSAVPLCLVFALGGRSVLRMLSLWRTRQPQATSNRAVVIGAGYAGVMMVEAVLAMPDRLFEPLAFLDDDPMKKNLRIRHLSVEGTLSDLRNVASRHQCTMAVIAIASISKEKLRRISNEAASLGINVQVMPPLDEIYADQKKISDVRPLTLEDLMGRQEIRTNLAEIESSLKGKRILVTGAGGSIGSELCRQIHRAGPMTLVMLDRDESSLHQVQLSIEGKALLDSRNLVVCDIRDRGALAQVFEEHQPELVFHAAALKHLPLLEMWPAEAIKTNVWGTSNVLKVSLESGVEAFINISTDKAADPISVLGYSKRIAERLTTALGGQGSGRYMSVRFGNVLGSRGSMLMTFRDQVAHGGPITVTHPDISRYFMTIPEAVQLTLQAAALGQTGRVLILEMGEPIRIDDVARQLAKESLTPIDIVYTGLRHGEKLHEQLFGAEEVDVEDVHPMIKSAIVPGFDLMVADQLPTEGPVDVVTEALKVACMESRTAPTQSL